MIYDPIGNGVPTNLAWARSELELSRATAGSDASRHRVQAVSHAKRALDCLFQELVRRDWLDAQLPRRPGFADRLKLLAEHPLVRVPVHLVPEFVARPRDVAEHEYVTPTKKEAALAIEAAEAVTAFINGQDEPLEGHALRGEFLKGWSYSETRNIDEVHFYGFTEPIGLTWMGSDAVIRVGVARIINETTADVVWCDMKSLTQEEHFELLKWWGRFRSANPGSMSEVLLRRLLKVAGLDQPAS